MCLWPFDTFWVWNLSRFFSCTQTHSEKEFNSLLRCNTVVNKKLLKILDDCLEASGRQTHFLHTTIRRATCVCPFCHFHLLTLLRHGHPSMFYMYGSIQSQEVVVQPPLETSMNYLRERTWTKLKEASKGFSNRIDTFLRNRAPSLGNMSKRKCDKTHIFNSSCVIVAHAWDALRCLIILVAPQWASIFNFNKGT
jgi:hypothetical protein